MVSENASVNEPVTLGASFQLLGNAWATLTSSKDNSSIIIRDSASDTSALPLPLPPYVITNIQSSSCSPPCSTGGSCNPASPVCTCLKGFNGTLCQSCAEGHFGSSCQPCPSNCENCDQGISGSGRCLPSAVRTAAKCKCLNGVCDSDGGCTCLPGWGASSNGTKCAQCEQGFFMTSTGGCQSMI